MAFLQVKLHNLEKKWQVQSHLCDILYKELEKFHTTSNTDEFLALDSESYSRDSEGPLKSLCNLITHLYNIAQTGEEENPYTPGPIQLNI